LNELMIILRIIHILSGIFWVGFAFFNIVFLQPTIRATGAEGQITMQHLMHQTRLMITVYSTATLTMVTGLIQYGIISHFKLAFLASGWGAIITTGSLAGIIAWIIAVFFIRSIFNQIGMLGKEIQAHGDTPDPKLLTQMKDLVAKLGHVGRIALGFMILSTISMAAARYSIF